MRYVILVPGPSLRYIFKMKINSAFITALLLGPLVLPVTALGQTVGRVGAPMSNARVPEKKREEAPPALPGSRAEPTAVAPADRTASDLPPTEALFDAINRGDLPTARDSLNRGADINGTNVLGLTPLELAVDLGRNEISFLLLSLRGANGYSTSGPPGAASKPEPRTRESRAQKLAAARAEREAAHPSARPIAASAATAPLQGPRLFAHDGGAAAPQAGFLGFNAGR